LKNEEIACTRCDTTLKTAVKAYERTSQPSARDARTAIREEEIEEAQGSNKLLQDRTLKSQLTTEELTAANEKPERSEKNAAAKIERTKIDPETQMQKVTELKKEDVDKKRIEEEQVAERQVRARETQVPSLSRELNESNVKVEELQGTRRRLQAERDELLEKVNNSISKEGLLTDTKRRLEARATGKLKKHQKLKAECKRRQKHREFLTSTLQHGSINHAVCRIRSQRQFPTMRHHDRRHIAGCLLRVHTRKTSRRAAPHFTNVKAHSATTYCQPSPSSEEEESDSASAGVRNKAEYPNASDAVPTQAPEATGRPQRVRRPPAKLADCVTD
jgi:hypothetical protein